MPNSTVSDLLQQLRARPGVSARELMRSLGVSQPTISRLLRQAGEQAVPMGQARARRYAASRELRGLGTHWPLYRIDAGGRPARLGVLHTLHGGGFHFAADNKPEWLQGEFAQGLFPGLPWFMHDMRPQDFLGRAFARHFGLVLGLCTDLALWSDDDVVTALLLRGDDVSGQFVLGEGALAMALAQTAEPIARSRVEASYVELAERATAGEPAGSSAAGEQAKFTACIEDENGAAAQVIVKFSDPVARQPAARRWADLLRAEHVAGRVLAENGIAAARTRVLAAGGRRFLESTRFDRIGAHGRVGLVSLAAIDDAHHGQRDDWARAAPRLQQDGWISAGDAAAITVCWWFGRLIGNTDMHFGNLSFELGDALPLRLAPIHDMLPMHYRPGAGGGIERPDHAPPAPLPEYREAWLRAAVMARTFWQRVHGTADLSDDFRAVAERQLHALDALHARFG